MKSDGIHSAKGSNSDTCSSHLKIFECTTKARRIDNFYSKLEEVVDLIDLSRETFEQLLDENGEASNKDSFFEDERDRLSGVYDELRDGLFKFLLNLRKSTAETLSFQNHGSFFLGSGNDRMKFVPGSLSRPGELEVKVTSSFKENPTNEINFGQGAKRKNVLRSIIKPSPVYQQHGRKSDIFQLTDESRSIPNPSTERFDMKNSSKKQSEKKKTIKKASKPKHVSKQPSLRIAKDSLLFYNSNDLDNRMTKTNVLNWAQKSDYNHNTSVNHPRQAIGKKSLKSSYHVRSMSPNTFKEMQSGVTSPVVTSEFLKAAPQNVFDSSKMSASKRKAIKHRTQANSPKHNLQSKVDSAFASNFASRKQSEVEAMNTYYHNYQKRRNELDAKRRELISKQGASYNKTLKVESKNKNLRRKLRKE